MSLSLCLPSLLSVSLSVVSAGSRVYVLGGVSSVVKNVLDTVECLDVEMGDWLDGTEPLPYAALGLRCVAISPADFE